MKKEEKTIEIDRRILCGLTTQVDDTLDVCGFNG